MHARKLSRTHEGDLVNNQQHDISRGKNLFLAIAYMVVGALSLLTGVFLLIVHVRYGKKVEDMLDLDMYTPYSG